MIHALCCRALDLVDAQTRTELTAEKIRGRQVFDPVAAYRTP